MIGAALMALGRTIADSNALGYSGPYQTSRRPAVRRDDRPEDGRDPNW